MKARQDETQLQLQLVVMLQVVDKVKIIWLHYTTTSIWFKASLSRVPAISVECKLMHTPTSQSLVL